MRKKLKISLSKCIHNVQEIIPLKLLFDLSRYLNSLPRNYLKVFIHCLRQYNVYMNGFVTY